MWIFLNTTICDYQCVSCSLIEQLIYLSFVRLDWSYNYLCIGIVIAIFSCNREREREREINKWCVKSVRSIAFLVIKECKMQN